MAPRSLTDLPDEIVRSICVFANWKDALSLQATCRRLGDVAGDHLLWKYYCQTCFRYWAASHQISTKLADATFTQWKQLFTKRQEAEYQTRSALEGVISSQKARTPKIDSIIGLGRDSKDVLLENRASTSDANDHLARRYWSDVALGCLHRSLAVNEWASLLHNDQKKDSFERAVGAFDLFILEDEPERDMDDIIRRLDGYVSDIRSAHPDIDDQSPRQKASTAAQFLIANNLVAIPEDREYYSIEHNFLGRALSSQEKNSLPIISAVIYCYVVRQLGLSAAPCGFPLHVHAIVYPPPGLDLEGNSLPSDLEPPALYMDPFRTSTPISVTSLNEQLNFLAANLTPSERDAFLSASTPSEIVNRCAHNIFNSLRRNAHPASNSRLDEVSAQYAAIWAHVLLPISPLHIDRYLMSLTHLICNKYQHDVSLVEKFLLPKPTYGPQRAELCRRLRKSDLEGFGVVSPKTRNRGADDVKYRVGQVFRHRRYDYTAVVTGWDASCEAEEIWIQRMRVDRLERGREQAFYHAFVQDDKTMRYVAEDSIGLISPAEIIPDAFPVEVGKWFKRWDDEKKVFVSNIPEEYPDD